MNERNTAPVNRADLLGQGGQADTQKDAQARPLAQQAEAEKAAQAEARAAEERAGQEQAAAEETAKAEADSAEPRAVQFRAEAEARAQAEEAKADQAAEADKAAAEAKARAAEQRAAAKAAVAKKPARPRRGPPADGGSEDRKDAILTTSKLSSAAGEKLRRGMVVSVPSRRLVHLERAGRVRIASGSELEIAERRYGRAELK